MKYQKKRIHSSRNNLYQKLNYENDQEKLIHAPLNLYLEYRLKNYKEKLIYAPLNLYQAYQLQPKLWKLPRKVDPLRQVVATSACTGDFCSLSKLSGKIQHNLFFFDKIS